MDSLNPHIYRCGPNERIDLADADMTDPGRFRKHIEPWLTAVFQSEHLSLLAGSGLPTAVALACGGKSADMSKCTLNCELSEKVDAFADEHAQRSGRGTANIEDQFLAAMQLRAGLSVMADDRATAWKLEIDKQLSTFLRSVLDSERSIRDANDDRKHVGEQLLVSFLLSFASRAATRERLNLFTTNYDRLIERGCDLAGLHVMDRFVGALSPIFRASRLNIDIHYNPPGIRGEPRYLEGVVRLVKLHGSLDWRWEAGELSRCALPFGAPADHPGLPQQPSESVMIYPNPAKDVETLDYPYAELFRDFAAAVCRPNSSLITYGYGFGDDHVNRVIQDMLTIPSTHLVVIAWDRTKPESAADPANGFRKRINRFCRDVGRPSQISLLLGSCFGDLATLVQHFLPKPAIDQITIRMTKLQDQRGQGSRKAPEGGAGEQAD